MTEHHSFVAPPVRVDAADNASGHTSVRALVTARIFARRLDRQLAVGVVGPAGSALAIHAARLESDNERHSIARAGPSSRRARVSHSGLHRYPSTAAMSPPPRM